MSNGIGGTIADRVFRDGFRVLLRYSPRLFRRRIAAKRQPAKDILTNSPRQDNPRPGKSGKTASGRSYPPSRPVGFTWRCDSTGF
jgi:hypothetical protein